MAHLSFEAETHPELAARHAGDDLVELVDIIEAMQGALVLLGGEPATSWTIAGKRSDGRSSRQGLRVTPDTGLSAVSL